MRHTIVIKKEFAPLVSKSLDDVIGAEGFDETMSVKTEENITVEQHKKGDASITVGITQADKANTEIVLSGDEALITKIREGMKKAIVSTIETDVVQKI